MSRGAMIFFAVLSFAAQLFSQPDVNKKKPNIVIIIADDQGYADVSYNPYHQKEVHTPNVDHAGKIMELNSPLDMYQDLSAHLPVLV